VIAFIDSTSGVNSASGANRNAYYITSFSNVAQDSTGVFLTNVGGQVSRLVAQRLVYRSGTINLAAGIDDLRDQFERLPVSMPAAALIVAAGSSSRSSGQVSADRLRSRNVYNGALSLACVSLGDQENNATLRVIASTGPDGGPLVATFPALRPSRFTLINAAFQIFLTLFGAMLCRLCICSFMC